jgi:hypothetical protein
MFAILRSARRAPQVRPHAVLIGTLALVAIWSALPRAWRVVKVFRDVLTGEVIVWDFQVYYTMSYLAARRLADQLYDASRHAAWVSELTGEVPEASLGFFYPPHFALALAPLSWLSHPVAFRVWFAANVVVLALVCALLWRVAAPAPRWQRALLLACVLLSDAFFHVIAAGQVSALLVLSMAGALLLIRSGREGAGGAVLALVTIKPQLLVGVLLLLALRGRWRALAGFGAVSAAFALAALAYFGPDGYIESAGALRGGLGADSSLSYTHMHSWRAFLATFDLDRVVAVHATVFVLMSVTALWGAAWAWGVGPVRGDGCGNQEWGVAVLVPLLITPHLWTQELLFLGLVGALLLSELAASPRDAVTPAAALLGAYAALSVSWSLLNEDVSLTVLLVLAAYGWSCLRPWRGDAVGGVPQSARAALPPRLNRAGGRATVPLP